MTTASFEEAERRRLRRLERRRALARYRTRSRVLRLVFLATTVLVVVLVVVNG